MTPDLLVTLFSGAGFLAGVGGLLHFFNTRKSARDRSNADAYTTYQGFVARAMSDAEQVNSRLLESRARLNRVRSLLIDLVLTLIALCVRLGADPELIEEYRDQLDEIRAM